MCNGFKLPAQFTVKVDDFTTWEIHATRQEADADVGDLAAPASASGRAPAPAALNVTVEPVGKGVWLLAGQSHHSVLVEFSETVPGKPLTQLVTPRHHFDHTAGLRAAIAEGLTVITYAGNGAWVENMAKRPHTRQPDALAKNPKSVTVETSRCTGRSRQWRS